MNRSRTASSPAAIPTQRESQYHLRAGHKTPEARAALFSDLPAIDSDRVFSFRLVSPAAIRCSRASPRSPPAPAHAASGGVFAAQSTAPRPDDGRPSQRGPSRHAPVRAQRSIATCPRPGAPETSLCIVNYLAAGMACSPRACRGPTRSRWHHRSTRVQPCQLRQGRSRRTRTSRIGAIGFFPSYGLPHARGCSTGSSTGERGLGRLA
jgi:hypothetical protein